MVVVVAQGVDLVGVRRACRKAEVGHKDWHRMAGSCQVAVVGYTSSSQGIASMDQDWDPAPFPWDRIGRRETVEVQG